ncbi:HAD family hydrolase [Parabacteroides sp. 52]|uniref:HAD family hydrolase n=1 Tax=unclassified Parabacteroides TaxID=2649774 RepID=UPI0013D4F64C|nr:MULTISPECIES: HAD-IA family hydrolase [unclassified Parabacteroides]MDH6534617.1 HAD superfamily hydrolase (TIGR01509 family) [Parabacteroides sp. PM5-20]NDV55151.1 HAD family hydrolase [Parabacteroides sp. 52]
MLSSPLQQYLNKSGYTSFHPQAVLFDMDGVLYDSMPYHVQAWSETAIHHALKHTPEDFYLFEGRTGEGTIQELFQRTFKRNATPEECEAIYKEKAERFNSYNQGATMKGAAEVLAKVKAYDLQTLVVTGSGQHSLIDKLNHDFPGYFVREKMVTAYDVKRGKPDPEPYLMGLEKAGVKANEALVVENAPMGVQAAVAAGIFTIAVNTGPLPDSVLWDAGANLLFHDMTELEMNWESIMHALLS